MPPLDPPDRLSQAEYGPCGAGEGALCCAYLVIGDGPECMRSTSMAPVIRAKVEGGGYTSLALPVKPYPQCQAERTEDVQ